LQKDGKYLPLKVTAVEKYDCRGITQSEYTLVIDENDSTPRDRVEAQTPTAGELLDTVYDGKGKGDRESKSTTVCTKRKTKNEAEPSFTIQG